MSNVEIANTILAQFGGGNRLKNFVSGKYFGAVENGLTFRFTAKAKNKANQVRVTLEPSDTYKVEFLRIFGNTVTTCSEHTMIYCDQLVDLFEQETGLYLTFNRRTA